MLSKTQLQNIDEVKILLPTESCEKQFRFIKAICQTQQNRTFFTKTVRKVDIRFSGIENNLWRFQLICLDYDIEAQHLGSTTILEKRDRIFDEIKIYVDQNGTIVSVINLKEIQDEWQITKDELLEKHEGAVLMDFISETNALLQDKESILQYVATKEMYELYFNSCWGYHDVRKPRFKELTIIIEKRIQQDRHIQDLQKIFNHDAILKIKKETKGQKQESEFTYKSNQLQEAFLEIEAENINSKYSIVCLTP